MVGGLTGVWQSLEDNGKKFQGGWEEKLNAHTCVFICIQKGKQHLCARGNLGISLQYWSAAKRQISSNGDLMAARHKRILTYGFSGGLRCCCRLCSWAWGRCVQLLFGTAQVALAEGRCQVLFHDGHQSFPFLASTKCVIGELRSGNNCTAEFSYFQRIAYQEWYVLLGSPDFLITKIFVSEFPRFVQE